MMQELAAQNPGHCERLVDLDMLNRRPFWKRMRQLRRFSVLKRLRQIQSFKSVQYRVPIQFYLELTEKCNIQPSWASLPMFWKIRRRLY